MKSRTEAIKTKKFLPVLGHKMAYLEVGTGDPIVFLHGNPTSSFLWRKVIPPLASLGRCIAPDLIGMGDSGKLFPCGAGTYRFVEHRGYLDALLDQLDVASAVTLVVHDWGSALGFDWANRHRRSVKGIAFMEALIRPISWADWPEQARHIFQGFRSEAGEQLILEKNYFIERVLPASVLEPLPSEVMEEYRRPYREPGESRRSTLTWPRQLPIDGDPADVTEIVHAYSQWLPTSEIPKLYVNAEPGFFSPMIKEETAGWDQLQVVSVRGHHFLQEDSGEEIGIAITDWYQAIAG